MRFSATALLSLWVFVLSACPPSLDEFVVVPADGAIPLRDSARPDSVAGDSARPDGGGAVGGPCAEPVLMVAVESIDTDAPPYGRVARFTLLPDDAVVRCGDLTGNRTLPAQPMVVAAVRDDLVLVADFQGAYALVEPVSDTIVGRGRIDGRRARDAFVLREPATGRLYPTVAWSNNSGESIRWITLHDAADTPHLEVSLTGGGTGLNLGLNIASITQSPVDPSRMLVLDSGAYAAAEADPFALTADTDTPYANVPDGANLATIAAVDRDGYERVIWTGTQAGGQGVFYVNDRATSSPSGPYTCDDRTCEIFHAVPDPRHPQDWLALCGGGVERDVVQFNQFAGGGRTCRVILAASEFESRTRYSYLATKGVL